MLFLSSFTSTMSDEKQPKTITRTAALEGGKEVEKTVIQLDASTSRTDLIHTCSFLAQENVQLTFDKLTIGKSFFGLVGKQRIRIAEGSIRLADGSSQSFKGGGATAFKTIRIVYSSNVKTDVSQIDMIEIID
jgi:hypothetical protein